MRESDRSFSCVKAVFLNSYLTSHCFVVKMSSTIVFIFVFLCSTAVAYLLPSTCFRGLAGINVRDRTKVGLGAWSTLPSLKKKLHSFYIQTTNVTYSEWSIYLDSMATTKEDGQKNVQEIQNNYFNLLSENPDNMKILTTKKSTDKVVDKGTSSSIDILREIMDLGGNWQVQLNIFRRNIALRNNRVLHPARNAMIFTSLINTMIAGFSSFHSASLLLLLIFF